MRRGVRACGEAFARAFQPQVTPRTAPAAHVAARPAAAHVAARPAAAHVAQHSAFSSTPPQLRTWRVWLGRRIVADMFFSRHLCGFHIAIALFFLFFFLLVFFLFFLLVFFLFFLLVFFVFFLFFFVFFFVLFFVFVFFFFVFLFFFVLVFVCFRRSSSTGSRSWPRGSVKPTPVQPHRRIASLAPGELPRTGGRRPERAALNATVSCSACVEATRSAHRVLWRRHAEQHVPSRRRRLLTPRRPPLPSRLEQRTRATQPTVLALMPLRRGSGDAARTPRRTWRARQLPQPEKA